ncbi:MAG TPA: SRPBCC domain-containing protein [Chitinophagaceae bacterium]
MESKNLIAISETIINAPVEEVWEALVSPAEIKKYMFNTTVVSDWKRGSKIVWKGDWKGKPYEDKGEILEIHPKKRLQYSHFSPLGGQIDAPENYHIVTIDLEEDKNKTKISLSQDKNPTEEAKMESEKNWTMMLSGLKTLLEERHP